MRKIIKSLKKIREKKRMQRMLCCINKEDIGLEIGPSLRPVASKADGYNVEIVDHLTKEQLTEKYSGMGLDTSKIEDVDYIWDGRAYTEVTGKENYYDYVIASHVIEHTTDFISFFQDCSKMLKNDGILSMAVPDKRYTFDHFRNVTTPGTVINDYLNPDKCGTVGALMDFSTLVSNRNGRTSWTGGLDWFYSRNYRFDKSVDENRAIYQDAIENHAFHDIHQYAFTPASFMLLIMTMQEYGFTDFVIDTFHKPSGGEFCVSLRKSDKLPVYSEKEKMKVIRKASRENVIN